MPSTSQLAKDIGVSRLTTKTAFEQLISEGFLEAHHGSGTYVARLSISDLPIVTAQRHRRKPKRIRISPHVERIENSMATTQLSHVNAFRPGASALDLFPRREWADAQSRAIRHGDNILFGYGPSSGLGALKSAIVSHVKDSRGIECAPEQIIVTSGA